jgi:hypothetical protein
MEKIEVTEEEIDEYLRRDPREVSEEIQRSLVRRILVERKRAELQRKIPAIDVTEEEIDEYLSRDPRERDDESRRTLARRLLYHEKRAELERRARSEPSDGE